MKIVFTSIPYMSWLNQLMPFIQYLKEHYPEHEFRFHSMGSGPLYADNVVFYGDWHVVDINAIHAKKIVYMHDTPLIDCDVKPSGVILPSSKWNAEMLENCGIKYDDYVAKPMFIPEVKVQKKYDLLINLTQPERKGHELLFDVLKRLQRKYKIAMILARDLTFNHPNVELFTAGSLTYKQVIELTASSKAALFTSYDEGIGLPPIEAAYLGLDLIISDAKAHNQFVDGTRIPITDIKIVKHSVMNKHFLYQYWDQDYLLEVLESGNFKKGQIIDDYPFKIDKIAKAVMGYFT